MVGGGLAGLAAALSLSGAGRRVVVHEAARGFGGRCRSYDEPALGRRVDNGNHLLLSGNRAALAYLDEIGAADRMIAVDPPRLPFFDLIDGTGWALRPGAGWLPWWLLHPGRRVPGAGLGVHLRALRLLTARPDATVAAVLDDGGALYRRLWRPLTLAALNTPPEEAAAALLRRALMETLGRGAGHCRPLIARDGLDDAFVAPALALLARRGAEIRRHAPVRGLELAGGRVAALAGRDGPVPLGPGDGVVLAVPQTAAARLLPGLTVPAGACPILNAHFRLEGPAALPGGAPFLGLLGGTAEWLFLRGDVLSVTVSAAAALIDAPAEALAARLWTDAARALGRPEAPLPPWRIVKERQATFAQTPANEARRPAPRVAGLANLVLAGDWTATGLPASIEGAVRSGRSAAALLQQRLI